ncbi:hypothetical protein Btru_033357 [Bulinus truncatus]|nr:hypothetical protein Btru_033357 [Bulinus truncatus]
MHQDKLWTRVHLGRCGLQPLLGRYKPIQEVYQEEVINRTKDMRVSSFQLPALSGPADIEFLRNKFGWCMPSAEQVIKTQKLKIGYRGDVIKETRAIIADLGSSDTSSTKTSVRRRIHQFYTRHHFVSKSSEQMDREKLIRKITNELKDYQNAVEYEIGHSDRRTADRFSTFQLHPNFGHAQRIEHLTSEIRHLERRQSEMNKISTRAKDSVNTHILMMKKKLSEKITKDIELTHEVRSKLDLSKSLERLEKLTKISRLESLRQKLLHTTREELTTIQVEESSEEDSSGEDVYKLGQPYCLLKRPTLPFAEEANLAVAEEANLAVAEEANPTVAEVANFTA